MNKLVSAFLIGGVFGLGIAISGMANPAKILNFFDLAGAWDPSLAFVMAGGLRGRLHRLSAGLRQREPPRSSRANSPCRRDAGSTAS